MSPGLECLELRVKEIDFAANQIVVRRDEGDKDRVTMLRQTVKGPLGTHLERVRAQHQRHLQNGLGRVVLPGALARKYPHASTEWSWQFVFAASRLCRDPRWRPPSTVPTYSVKASMGGPLILRIEKGCLSFVASSWNGTSCYHLHESVVQQAVKDAVRRAGPSKRVTCHTFPHSFANTPA